FAFARINRLSEANLAQDLALAMVALTLAWLTYVLVEQPIRRGTLAIPNMRMLRAGAISLGRSLFLQGPLAPGVNSGPKRMPRASMRSGTITILTSRNASTTCGKSGPVQLMSQAAQPGPRKHKGACSFGGTPSPIRGHR